MKLLVTYCTTPDGFGTDQTVEISVDCTLYSIHKSELNLVSNVCEELDIDSIQLIRIQLKA